MSKFNHTKSLDKSSLIREVVFGMEDGMVSTLGAITGIAIGSQEQFIVLLSGFVIIGVESVSMGVGSYLSNRISKEVDIHTVREEMEELQEFPTEEMQELYRMFIRDGWSNKLAFDMTKHASFNKQLMLREMQYRELGISPIKSGNPLKNAFLMYCAYIIGGLIPLVSYIMLPVQTAILTSIPFTLIALFLLGVGTTKYTGGSPVISGLRIFTLGGIALLVGILMGEFIKVFE